MRWRYFLRSFPRQRVSGASAVKDWVPAVAETSSVARGLFLFLALVLDMLAAASQAHAADPRYPDWPCAQAKVPEISLAAVWAGPALDDVGVRWKDDARINALVARLAARRVALEDADRQIAEFLTGSAGEKRDKAKLLFAGLFDTLNAQRSSIMTGLERITRKQREAADKIRADTLALHALQDANPPEPAKIEDMANQVTWGTRIFEDRRRVIRFVCEVPVAIDQRLFALGRTIQQGIE